MHLLPIFSFELCERHDKIIPLTHTSPSNPFALSSPVPHTPFFSPRYQPLYHLKAPPALPP